MTEAEARAAVGHWLSLVAADTELSPYLIGVDWDRLNTHLARLLTAALDDPDGPLREQDWRGLRSSEAQHRRAVDYLAGVLRARDLPTSAVAAAVRAVVAGA
ncbi:hypothetical protein AB0I37_26615 [Micromonospora purpureochromogenes]|uniref:hypothetical protein n=1 Tax=Micromonospora purpureochromogenes TaxID=47872 RepID=UPI0033CFE10D